MKNLAKYTCLIALLAVGVRAQAQADVTLYHMKDLPHNNQLNPAFQPKNGSAYVNFPIAFNLGASIYGKGLTAETVLNMDKGGSIGTIPKKDAAFQADFSAAMPLSFGFMVRDMHFSFDMQLKVHAEGRVPVGLMNLAWYGNGAPETLGKQLSLEGLGVTAYAYGEVALGFSKEILKNSELTDNGKNKMVVGGKLKYLQGAAYVQANLGEDSYIHTDKDKYHITASVDPEVYVSGIKPDTSTLEGVFKALENIDYMDFLKNITKNRGVAIDLGGTWDMPYDLSWNETPRKMTVSASLLDVGFIRWHGTSLTNTAKDKRIVFDGFDMSNGGFLDGLQDSVMQRVDLTVKDGTFTKWLAPTMYLGANYHLFKYLNAGALVGFKFNKYETLPFFALSANSQHFPLINGSTSFSYYNGHGNIGFGLLLGRKGFQMHLITDNLLTTNYKTAQSATFRMGMNFLLGRHEGKRKARIEERKNRNAMPATPDGDVTPDSPQEEPAVDTGATSMSKEDLLKKALAEEAAEREDELMKKKKTS